MPSSHLGSCAAPHETVDRGGTRPQQCTRTGANRRSRSHYVVHDDHPGMDGLGHEGILQVLPSLGSRQRRLVRFRPIEPEQRDGGEAQTAGDATAQHLGMVISAHPPVGPRARHPRDQVARDPVPPGVAARRGGQRKSAAPHAPELEPEDERPRRPVVQAARGQSPERGRRLERRTGHELPRAGRAESRTGRVARSTAIGGRETEHDATLARGCDRSYVPSSQPSR